MKNFVESVIRKFIPPTEFLDQLKKELQPYDMSFRAKILNYESNNIGNYIKFLRLSEYFKKNNPIIGAYYQRKLRAASLKTGFQIGLYTCGSGIRFYHWGWCIINGKARIGKNVTLYPGVCIGRTEKGVPVIGDNVFIGLGAKVLGDIKVGNNVTIAPNAVVVKDVPDNCVVGGVPAKIIKYK